jgi:hypothetical protein
MISDRRRDSASARTAASIEQIRRSIQRLRMTALVLAGFAYPPTSAASAQSPSVQGILVLTIATDTFAVERYSRAADRLEGELTGPSIGKITYVATLGPTGEVVELALNAWLPGTDSVGPASQEARIRMEADSAVAEIIADGRTVIQRLQSVAGAHPYVNPSFALIEQIVLHSESSGAPADGAHLFIAQGGSTHPAIVDRISPDSVVFTLAGMEARLSVSTDGVLRGGVVPVQNLRVHRTERLPNPSAAGAAVAVPSLTLPAGRIPRNTVHRRFAGHRSATARVR